MTFRVETQNLTDRVGSPPIMDAKRSRRKGSKEEFSLETEGDPNNPLPPLLRREGSGNKVGNKELPSRSQEGKSPTYLGG